MKMLSVVCVVCIMGAIALYGQTDGYTVVTTESARRADILREPRGLPDAELTGVSGDVAALRENLRRDGRLTIVDFIYTRCASLCLAMGTEFQQLQQAILDRGLESRVRLLSLSFDPMDTPRRLATYGQRMHAEPKVWEFATLSDKDSRDAILGSFGIVVVPAPGGQYVHNAAYHVVSGSGYLMRIMDIGDTAALLDFADRRTAAATGQDGQWDRAKMGEARS